VALAWVSPASHSTWIGLVVPQVVMVADGQRSVKRVQQGIAVSGRAAADHQRRVFAGLLTLDYSDIVAHDGVVARDAMGRIARRGAIEVGGTFVDVYGATGQFDAGVVVYLGARRAVERDAPTLFQPVIEGQVVGNGVVVAALDAYRCLRAAVDYVVVDDIVVTLGQPDAGVVVVDDVVSKDAMLDAESARVERKSLDCAAGSGWVCPVCAPGRNEYNGGYETCAARLLLLFLSPPINRGSVPRGQALGWTVPSIPVESVAEVEIMACRLGLSWR
jgi:hypothetical protein